MTKRITRTAIVVAFAAMLLFSLSSFAKVTVNFNVAGSSAMFNTFALSGYGSATCGGNIWTYKNGAQGVDLRGGGAPTQTGNVWIEWDNSSAPTVVCAYLSVDSVVGNQLYFAQPTSTLNILEPAGTAGMDLVPTLTDTAGGLPQAVINALESQAFNAAMTDIRPEDALFATNRALGTLNTVNYNGLGYGPGPVGTAILSTFSTKSATPVGFALTGSDPISGKKAKSWTTVSVGATPVVIFVNTTQTSGGNGDFSNSNAFQNINRLDLLWHSTEPTPTPATFHRPPGCKRWR